MTLQFRRGTDSDRLTITPAVGEPIYTTDTKSLYIGDGSTAGGTLVTGSGGTDSATVSAIINTTFGAIDTDLIPNGTDAYDLGNPSNQWNNLYLSGTSLHLGGHKIVRDGNTIKFTDSADATISITAGNVASSLIDSSDVTAIITAGGYTTYDSGNASGQITTAINSLIAAAPESLDTLNELAAALGDDANFAATVTAQIAALPDSAQVATIVTSYGYTTYDSANTTGMLSSYATQTYVNNAVAALPDSTQVSAIITADVDAAFINALTIDADTLGGQNSAYHLNYNNFTNKPTALSSFTNDTNYLDSTTVTGVINASYIQANQTTYDFLDSAEVINLIDSAYIQARQVDLQRDSSFVSGIITSYGYSTYDSGNFTGQLAAASTSDLSEGTNLYYTTVRADSDAKAAISVTDAGGDGSLTYNSGVITYTGPSASEVRAHFTAGTGVTISSGQVSIGQAVGTSDSVTFSGLTVSGNLNITGTTTTVNSITYTVTDPLLHLADSNETSDLVDIGFIGHYSPDGGSTKEHTGFFRDASNAEYYIFNGLVDAAFDSSIPTNIVDRNGTGFELATLNVGSIVGQYAGFDSDVTAAGLATQTYVTNAVAALPDSAQVATIVTSYGYSTYDSGNFTGQLTAATGSSIFAYDGNLQSFVTAFTLPTSDGTTGQVLQTNGSGTLSFVTQSSGTDSATVSSIVTSTVDSAYVQLRQTTVSGGATTISNYFYTADSGQTTFTGADDALNTLNYTADKLQVYLNGILLKDSDDYTAENGSSIVLTTAADSNDILSVSAYVTQSVGTLDSTGVINLIDSAYIQLRDTPQDFAYSSLTGAPTNVSSFTNDAGYTTYDSANTTGMLSTYATQTYVDNAVAALPDSAQVATIVTSYGYSTYDSTNAAGQITAYGYSTYDSGNFTGQLTAATGTSVLAYDANLQGFVDAFTLPTSDGTTNQVLITNGSGTISFADQSGGLDSAAIINLIDSAYVAAREADAGGGGGTTQQTFKTIAISGQSDVVADDSADTLTLVAGTGITLTTDAGTDTITITASGGGGGGGLDSAATNTLIDAKLQVLDVTDLVGADGNPGEYLKTLGNGETEWSDLKLSDYKPTSATASGSKGEITYDSAHLYVCIATNSWRRIIWTDSSW